MPLYAEAANLQECTLQIVSFTFTEKVMMAQKKSGLLCHTPSATHLHMWTATLTVCEHSEA